MPLYKILVPPVQGANGLETEQIELDSTQAEPLIRQGIITPMEDVTEVDKALETPDQLISDGDEPQEKLKISEATEAQLKALPYVSAANAKKIKAAASSLTSLEEVKELASINDDLQWDALQKLIEL